MDDHLVWIDLEMTGLDIDTCTIIEIATIVTDGYLNIIEIGPNLAINVDETYIEAMDEWNTKHHHESGLVQRVRESDESLSSAEQKTLDFLRKHVEEKKAPLCGNSIWNDRRFLEKFMPKLSDFLHYRMVDVSSVKEISKRWYPKLPQYEKKGAHLALDDIIESIEELKHFRKTVFIPSDASSDS